MKIKRLELKDGYKRFHHLTIDLGDKPARIIALVGPNGCGKSSALDGLLFMHTSQQQVIGQSARDNRYHSMHGTAYSAAKSIRIIFDQGPYADVRAAKLKLGSEKANTLFSFRSCYRYNAQVKITESRAMNPIGLNNYGASVSADLDGKMEDNYRRLHAKFNRYFKEKNVTYQQAATDIIGELNASLKKCLDLQIEDLGNIDDDKGTLYFKKPDHPKPFEFNVLSAGEKEAVDILLDLYLRKVDYDDTIFLIDEPELHINTAVQRKLLIEINNLIGVNCQLWVATHSVGFLRALQQDLKDQCQVIQFKAGLPYASQDVSLIPVRPTLKVWRDIFETALDDLAGLVSPKRLIYCEGRDKPGTRGAEKGLDAQVYNTVFGSEYVDTQFVSSGGNTELEQRSAIALAILSKVFPSIEILVLKDRDMASGKPVSENERVRVLGSTDTRVRILKRWEIENYLFDKEVLTAYCAANELSLDSARYDGLVNNIVDDDVKATANSIKGGMRSADWDRHREIQVGPCCGHPPADGNLS